MTIITEITAEKRKVMTEEPAIGIALTLDFTPSKIKIEYDIYPDMLHVYQCSPEGERRTVALIPTNNNELNLKDKQFANAALQSRLAITTASLHRIHVYGNDLYPFASAPRYLPQPLESANIIRLTAADIIKFTGAERVNAIQRMIYENDTECFAGIINELVELLHKSEDRIKIEDKV